MATFAWLDLGLVTSMNSGANPAALQVNAFPGVSGLQVLWGGARGGVTVADGVFAADSPGGLSAAFDVGIAMAANATMGVLVDTKGRSWPNVILTSFSPVGPVIPAVGGYCQNYHAEFLHLS